MSNAKQMSAVKIILGIFVISFIVFVHELGHFGACKLFNVETPIFSIGFGPTLLSKQIGETEFRISALPLGGYVSINQNDLNQKNYLQKMFITLAGIINNLLLAFFFFFLVRYYSPLPETIPTIEEIVPDSPADQAGLQMDDTIVAVENKSISKNLMPHLIAFVQSNPGETISLTINRNGNIFDVPITIAKNHPEVDKDIGWIGTYFYQTRPEETTFTNAVKGGIKGVFTFGKNMIPYIKNIILDQRRKGQSGFRGPIGIIALAGMSFAFGWSAFLTVMGLISLNLGIFNLLPIPLLDGGQAFRYTLQALNEVQINEQMYTIIRFIILLLLIGFILYITRKDIKALRS